MMFDELLQPTHLLVLLAVVLFFFGGKKLPELGKGLGDGLRGFRDGIRGVITREPSSNAQATAADVTQ
jgi:sec-independent protein translocase protein TatA